MHTSPLVRAVIWREAITVTENYPAQILWYAGFYARRAAGEPEVLVATLVIPEADPVLCSLTRFRVLPATYPANQPPSSMRGYVHHYLNVADPATATADEWVTVPEELRYDLWTPDLLAEIEAFESNPMVDEIDAWFRNGNAPELEGEEDTFRLKLEFYLGEGEELYKHCNIFGQGLPTECFTAFQLDDQDAAIVTSHPVFKLAYDWAARGEWVTPLLLPYNPQYADYIIKRLGCSFK